MDLYAVWRTFFNAVETDYTIRFLVIFKGASIIGTMFAAALTFGTGLVWLEVENTKTGKWCQETVRGAVSFPLKRGNKNVKWFSSQKCDRKRNRAAKGIHDD